MRPHIHGSTEWLYSHAEYMSQGFKQYLDGYIAG